MFWMVVEILGVIAIALWLSDEAWKNDSGWLIIVILIVAAVICFAIWGWHENQKEEEEKARRRSEGLKRENSLIDKYNDCLNKFKTIGNQYFNPNNTIQQNKLKEILSLAVFVEAEMQKFTWSNTEAYELIKTNIPLIIADTQNMLSRSVSKSRTDQWQRPPEKRNEPKKTQTTKEKSRFDSLEELEIWYRRRKREMLSRGQGIEQLNIEYEEQRALIDE